MLSEEQLEKCYAEQEVWQEEYVRKRERHNHPRLAYEEPTDPVYDYWDEGDPSGQYEVEDWAQ